MFIIAIEGPMSNVDVEISPPHYISKKCRPNFPVLRHEAVVRAPKNNPACRYSLYSTFLSLACIHARKPFIRVPR